MSYTPREGNKKQIVNSKENKKYKIVKKFFKIQQDCRRILYLKDFIEKLFAQSHRSPEYFLYNIKNPFLIQQFKTTLDNFIQLFEIELEKIFHIWSFKIYKIFS